jgi:hypothetical protein
MLHPRKKFRQGWREKQPLFSDFGLRSGKALDKGSHSLPRFKNTLKLSQPLEKSGRVKANERGDRPEKHAAISATLTPRYPPTKTPRSGRWDNRDIVKHNRVDNQGRYPSSTIFAEWTAQNRGHHSKPTQDPNATLETRRATPRRGPKHRH